VALGAHRIAGLVGHVVVCAGLAGHAVDGRASDLLVPRAPERAGVARPRRSRVPQQAHGHIPNSATPAGAKHSAKVNV